jgi:hypothetical protein
MLEGHDGCKFKSVIDPDSSVEFRLFLLLQVIKVNILHLANLALPSSEYGYGIEVGMKNIPKPVVNSHHLPSGIGVHFLGLLGAFPTLGVINHWMSHCVLRSSPLKHITIVPHIAIVKLYNVQRGVRAATRRDGVPYLLKPLLCLNILLMCIFIIGRRCCCTAASAPPLASSG